jgi:hypothetical protein
MPQHVELVIEVKDDCCSWYVEWFAVDVGRFPQMAI